MEFTGERFIPGIDEEQIVQEHYHRYYSVLPLCQGKSVLDIASGEGYGSALLATRASEVIGVDIAADAVLHAKNTYVRENLQFLEGSVSDIPVENGTADVVVSFETIEHVDEETQKTFMREVKRVLKDDGILIVSTPNKYICTDVDMGKNPFHVKEFYVDEFYAFLKAYYPFVKLFYQNAQMVSVIGDAENKDFAPISEKALETAKAHYVIAVCGSREVDADLTSAFLPGSNKGYDEMNRLVKWGLEQDKAIAQKDARIEELAAWGNGLDQTVIQKDARIKELADWGSKLDQTVLEKDAAIKELTEQTLSLTKTVQEKDESLRALKALQAQYAALLTQKQQEEEKVLFLTNTNSSLKNTVTFLESELHKIRGNRFYRFFVRFYKFFKRVKNRTKQEKTAIVSPQAEKSEKMPLVSIIIPVYNNVPYLRQCFDSALSQTYENIEIVAVDDCSPDPEVAVILAEYAMKNPKFKYYKNEMNSGISVTQNNCIIRAEGEWIAMLDCDDWLEPFAVEHLMQKIMSQPGAKYGYTDRYNYNNADGSMQQEDFSCRPTHDYLENLLQGMYTCHLKIIHKDVFRKVGLHDPETDGIQDYDIALKVAFYMGDSIFAYLHEPVYYHRIHAGQETQQKNEKLSNLTEFLRAQARFRMAVRGGEFDKLISFVVLSFEKKEYTVRCIRSIEETVKVPHEIILFDNASSAETVQYLKEHLTGIPNLKMQFSDKNLHCGGGRRAALQSVKGEYTVCLDNDIVVYDGWLEEMLVRMEFHSNVAAVCAKVIFPNDLVQFNGGKFIVDKPFIHFSLIGQNMHKDDLETCTYEKSDWVPGGATLFKTDIFRKIEGLEEYPNAFEDNDTALQLEKMGYICLNCPASVILHNHIMLNEEQKKQEKRYLKHRYDTELFEESALVFYKRNGLIVRDEFIFNLMGLAGASNQEIEDAFKERVKKLQK